MKKDLKLISTAVAASLLLVSCTINKPADPIRTVTVTGTGSITIPADIATIEFIVTTTGWSAKAIAADNDTLSARLADAIKNVGVNETDISIGDCTISTPTQQYESRRSVIVTVRNIALVPAVIDCKTGTIRLKNIEYKLNDTASPVRRARTAAVQQSQDAGSLLAGASGAKIGQVMNVTESEVKSSISSDGKITTTSNVVVTYAIQ